MFWISIMDVEPLRRCSLMKMSKKIPIAGVRRLSAGKNSGKSRANGCGTRLLSLGHAMQGGELRGHPRGHHPKSVPLYARFRREPPRHTAAFQWAGDAGGARGRDLCQRLHVAREWHPAMSSGVEPVAQRTASRTCLDPTSRLRWLAGRLSAMSAA
jgi:hypothetical protein